MKAPLFETEAALCAAFLVWVKAEGGKVKYGSRTPVWTPYAETAGWDILLVAEDGTQIGVQAKQKFNMKVLSQCLPDRWSSWNDRGPDYRAVLVPDLDRSHADICAALGLMLITGKRGYGGDPEFTPGLDMEHCEGWHYWNQARRCDLPEFVPDVPAGASGPVQLTKWKIAALRVAATLQVRGHVTRQDFKEIGIDHRRWVGPGDWIKPGDVPGQYVRGSGLNFDTQHPDVYAQVLAEVSAKLEAKQ
ncbi:hypothetical protein D9M73_66020 [compost metagenome]|nr:MAG TPA: hypothetical protein [Caudoviricetes sp.]